MSSAPPQMADAGGLPQLTQVTIISLSDTSNMPVSASASKIMISISWKIIIIFKKKKIHNVDISANWPISQNPKIPVLCS